MLPSADKLLEMQISFFSRTLATVHSAKTTFKCLADIDITVLDWPANIPDLNPMEHWSQTQFLEGHSFAV